MAMGGLSLGSRRETIVKELLGGLFTGVVFGVVSGVAVYALNLATHGSVAWNSPVAVASIIGAGLIGGCAAGTLLGIASPLFFARIGVDPAIAAGPIVTAFNDFLSMTIYFLIAWGVASIIF
jgi:magnesium transporter